MIFQNMEFHNVECLEERLGGYMLQRFPEKVRLGLGYQDHDRGRMFSQMPVGCEIRFVTDAHFFRISLASYEKRIESSYIEVIFYRMCWIFPPEKSVRFILRNQQDGQI